AQAHARFLSIATTRNGVSSTPSSAERIRQHSASVQIHEDGDKRSKFVWTVDVLPNEIAPYISGQMDLSIAAMKKRLEDG
uniref:hypothetical protein n=1 Tax=Acinetobacter baumannii TaxID=470 RepID=UPI001BB46B0B